MHTTTDILLGFRSLDKATQGLHLYCSMYDINIVICHRQAKYMYTDVQDDRRPRGAKPRLLLMKSRSAIPVHQQGSAVHIELEFHRSVRDFSRSSDGVAHTVRAAS